MQDGVNWLAFLARYQLHGILCDDMGLGKTLQALCILASDHYQRAQTYQVWLLCLLYSHRLHLFNAELVTVYNIVTQIFFSLSDEKSTENVLKSWKYIQIQ